MNADTQSVMFSSESAEHYTPAAIVQAVVNCMGGIDLDPCADPGHRIPAAQHYTKHEGSLCGEWFGKIYMNPPYGRTLGMWIEKLLGDYRAGNVDEAITLLPARVDTKWYALLRDFPVCHVRGRLKFDTPDGPGAAGAPFPSAIFYLGKNLPAFIREFSKFGDIWVRVKHENLIAGDK